MFCALYVVLFNKTVCTDTLYYKMWGEDRERGRDREEEEEEKGRRTTLGGGGMGIIRTQQYFQKGTACFRKFS